MKCNIKDCENEAEFIKKPVMWNGTFCRQHFDEIYIGIIYEEGPDTDELVSSGDYRRATLAEKQAKKEG